jgi:hypothetical protein
MLVFHIEEGHVTPPAHPLHIREQIVVSSLLAHTVSLGDQFR